MKNNRRGFLIAAIALVAVVAMLGMFKFVAPVLSAPSPMILDSSGIHVNPVAGLGSDFIMGADVSMLAQMEANGAVFYENGKPKDCLTILKDQGVNWIRLRIWNDPTDAKGQPLGGGNNDLAKTVMIAKRAKAMGLKFFLDFHYSDWWADPGKQNKPKAWTDLHGDALSSAVYDYTASVLRTLAKAGAMPDMIELGNEINGGILWPDGNTGGPASNGIGGYDVLANLLGAGAKAVRDVDPNSGDPGKRARILIHLANGGDNALYRRVFDELTKRKVDFDVIGLSYYSYWHGTINQFRNNMNDVSARYGKDVVVAEASYAYTLKDADATANLFSEKEQKPGGYKATLQGQATAIRDVIEAVAKVPNGRGLGIFYWEPDWYAVPDAGWQTGAGDAWDNQAMFDSQGNALPSLNVFRLVKPGSGRETIPATITEIYPTELRTPVGEPVKLPAVVDVAYSDDSIRRVVAIWPAVDPANLASPGKFTIYGTVAGTDLKAAAVITVSGGKNFVANPGFESGDLTSWTVTGDAKAVDVRQESQNVHSGSSALHYWLDTPFSFTVTQTITGLENGTYSLSAWIQGGGGETTLQLFATDYGGATLTADAVTTAWQEWKTPVIEKIVVTNGTCTIGLKVAALGGTWAFLDDVELTKVE
jgi:arabinogalactan endo-1,4-beta-galactosidase